MDELVQWLGEQLDKDGQIARACSGDGKWDERDVVIYAPNLGEEVRAHMVEHDPARVLREIEAKREALAHYERIRQHTRQGDEAYLLAEGAVSKQIQIMATAYADRPGYKESWRP